MSRRKIIKVKVKTGKDLYLYDLAVKFARWQHHAVRRRVRFTVTVSITYSSINVRTVSISGESAVDTNIHWMNAG